MDNKYYHRGSGVVVEVNKPLMAMVFIFSLPAIGSIDPSYPVGWVGDDVEMVWQVWSGTDWLGVKDSDYWQHIYKRAHGDDRRILFMPKERGITSPAPDYTKEAEELYPVPNIEDFEDSKDWSSVREENGFKRAAHIAARQQSAAEIDRLRGEVRKLRDGLGEKSQSELWDEVEEIFDKHTSPTGGGYEADYTDRHSFFNDLKEKFVIQKIQLLTETEG